jgi:hypothetical protein
MSAEGKKMKKRAGKSVGVSVWDANREIERSGKRGGVKKKT